MSTMNKNNLINSILGDSRITPKVKHWIAARTGWISPMLDSPPSLNTVGTWRVHGEDENRDLGGTHHMPFLGYFHGPYWEVLNAAVETPKFFAWGAGGKLVWNTCGDFTNGGHPVIYTASMSTAKVPDVELNAKKLNAMASIVELSKEISRCADKLEAETELLRIEHELAFQALSSLPGGEHIVKALKLEAANRLSDQ